VDIAEDQRMTVSKLLWLTELEVKPLVDGAVVVLPSAPPWATSSARRTWHASPNCVDLRRSGGGE
jgi:hypothetical protein